MRNRDACNHIHKGWNTVQLTHEQCGDYGCWPLHSQRSVYNFWFPPKLTCSPLLSLGNWFHDPHWYQTQWVLKSLAWNSTEQRRPSVLRICRLPTAGRKCCFWSTGGGIRGCETWGCGGLSILKYLCIRGPTQFKPMLFNGQLQPNNKQLKYHTKLYLFDGPL